MMVNKIINDEALTAEEVKLVSLLAEIIVNHAMEQAFETPNKVNVPLKKVSEGNEALGVKPKTL